MSSFRDYDDAYVGLNAEMAQLGWYEPFFSPPDPTFKAAFNEAEQAIGPAIYCERCKFAHTVSLATARCSQ